MVNKNHSNKIPARPKPAKHSWICLLPPLSSKSHDSLDILNRDQLEFGPTVLALHSSVPLLSQLAVGLEEPLPTITNLFVSMPYSSVLKVICYSLALFETRSDWKL